MQFWFKQLGIMVLIAAVAAGPAANAIYPMAAQTQEASESGSEADTDGSSEAGTNAEEDDENKEEEDETGNSCSIYFAFYEDDPDTPADISEENIKIWIFDGVEELPGKLTSDEGGYIFTAGEDADPGTEYIYKVSVRGQEITGSFYFSEQAVIQKNIKLPPHYIYTNGQDEELWEMLSVKEADNIYERDGKLYIRAGSDAAFEVADNTGTFTGVIFTSDGSQNSIKAPVTDGAFTPSFYFTTDKTRTDADPDTPDAQDNAVPAGVLLSDAQAPSVSFTDEAGNDITNTGFLSNRQNTVTVKAQDALSGVKSLSYDLFTVKNDDEIDEKIKADKDDGTKWKTVPEDASVKVPDMDPPQGGYYVLSIKAEDNVGNISFTVMGKATVDMTAPAVQITGIADAYYKSDVPYTITAADTGNPQSGIEKVNVTVTKAGKRTKRNKESLTDSFSLSGEEISRYTDKEGTVSVPASVLADGCTDNSTTICVTVTDRAGNTGEASQTVKILPDAPSVTVSYDNNSPRNGKYFNRSRTMTLVFNDRTFQADRAFLSLSTNGKSRKLSLAELQNGGITGVSIKEGPSDSQKSYAEESLTDDRTVVYKIVFDTAQGDEISFSSINSSITNAAGTESTGTDFGSSAAPDDFIIDKETPKIELSFTNDGKTFETAQNGTVYEKGSAAIDLSVKESNFEKSDVDITVHSTDASGNQTDAYDSSSVQKAENTGNWEIIGNSAHTSMDTFTQDGNYSISVVVTDPAGNRAEYATRYFTIDNTVPEGSLTVRSENGEGSMTGLKNRFMFWLFGNRGMTATWTASDKTSGVQRADYYIYRPHTDDNEFNGLSENELKNVPWRKAGEEIHIGNDTAAAVYLRITDNAGNTSYISSVDGIITEDDAPNVTIKTDTDKKVYGGNVPFTVTVNENTGTESSGLKTVRYTITKDGVVTQTGDFGSFNGRVHSFTGRGTVSAAENNSNNVTISVTATDRAGNTFTQEKSIAIDITPPALSLSYDNNNAQNGKYYNSGRTLSITVAERNFDKSLVNIKAISADGKKVPESNWKDGGIKGTDLETHTLMVPFTEDGEYTFTMDMTDMAGNTTRYGKTDSFIVDKTAPVISVSYDNNNAQNGKYYNKTRTATITVRDRNFDQKTFAAAIRASLEGKGVSAPSAGKWTKSGDTWTATIPFSADGDYAFSVNAKDLAGNAAQTYTSDNFTIDRTPPEISITGIQNGGAYHGQAAPVITCTDKNYIMKSAGVTVSGRFHDPHSLTGVYSESGGVETFTAADFPHEQEYDDVYTLKAYAKDLAGNVTQKIITFSVNRFGSNYTVDKKTKAYIEKPYNKEARDIVIYETNVDELSGHTVTISADGDMKTLTEGEDYKAEEVNDDKAWHRYKYTIYAKNFDRSGTYEIKISSRDKAGNLQDNTTRDDSISFVLDKDAPDITVTGIEDGAVYEETSHTVEVTAADNYELSSITAYVDGKKLSSVDKSVVDKGNGTCSFTIPASSSWQILTFEAEDKAGNIQAGGKYKVLITADKKNMIWEKYHTVILAGIILVLCAVIFVIIRKKKKYGKEKEG